MNGNCALESLSPEISALGIGFQDKEDRRSEEGSLFNKAIDVEGRQPLLCNVAYLMHFQNCWPSTLLIIHLHDERNEKNPRNRRIWNVEIWQDLLSCCLDLIYNDFSISYDVENFKYIQQTQI
jgi:hypothetical protein